jgi:hypothetical protein
MTAAEPWERPCTTCDGSGRVISQAWLAWHAEYVKLERMTDVTARLAALAKHVRRAPQEPEEATCPECGGEGVVVTELGLTLLDFLDRRFGVRQRTPKAEPRSLPPPPPIEPPRADPHGRPGTAWTGPADQSAFFAEEIAGGQMRAIAPAVPYPSPPDTGSALRGQADEADPADETSHNHLPAVATLAVSPQGDLGFEAAGSAGEGLRPPPDLAGLPSVPPIPPDGDRAPGIPPSRGAQSHPRALPPSPPDTDPPLGTRPQWRSDDTGH